MNLIITAGFLGSGKTTLLLTITRHLISTGLRVAIIENEVGAAGVDDKLLREEGLSVRELYSGCICCSLRIDLVTTLLELEREYNPDTVILEPSGVAGPQQVIDALAGYGGEIEETLVLLLLDAVRFEEIYCLSIPIIENGIMAADLVALNKADAVNPDVVAAITDRVHQLRDDVTVQPISALDGSGVDELLALIDTMPSESRRENPPDEKPEALKGAIVSAVSFSLPDPGGDQLSGCVAAALAELGLQLKNAGCTMIGHIKVIIRSTGGGYVALSMTEAETPPIVRGRLPKTVKGVSVVVNAIVFGVDKLTVDRLLHNLQKRIAGETTSGA